MSKQILVVDDDPAIFHLLEGILTPMGYNCESVGDGINALSVIKEKAPDLVVLDVMMPKLDGYNVCRQLKFDENLKDVPVIILTSRKSSEDEKLSKDVGANAFLTKPIDSSEIIKAIKSILES